MRCSPAIRPGHEKFGNAGQVMLSLLFPARYVNLQLSPVFGLQGFQEADPIGLIFKNILTPIAPAHHMIERPFKLHPDLARHPFSLLKAASKMREKRTEPFPSSSGTP
jgi:hypothetical protein